MIIEFMGWSALGAILMATAVLLGAFGAHVLKASLAADAWIAAWVMLAAGALR